MSDYVNEFKDSVKKSVKKLFKDTFTLKYAVPVEDTDKSCKYLNDEKSGDSLVRRRNNFFGDVLKSLRDWENDFEGCLKERGFSDAVQTIYMYDMFLNPDMSGEDFESRREEVSSLYSDTGRILLGDHLTFNVSDKLINEYDAEYLMSLNKYGFNAFGDKEYKSGPEPLYDEGNFNKQHKVFHCDDDDDYCIGDKLRARVVSSYLSKDLQFGFTFDNIPDELYDKILDYYQENNIPIASYHIDGGLNEVFYNGEGKEPHIRSTVDEFASEAPSFKDIVFGDSKLSNEIRDDIKDVVVNYMLDYLDDVSNDSMTFGEYLQYSDISFSQYYTELDKNFKDIVDDNGIRDIYDDLEGLAQEKGISVEDITDDDIDCAVRDNISRETDNYYIDVDTYLNYLNELSENVFEDSDYDDDYDK